MALGPSEITLYQPRHSLITALMRSEFDRNDSVNIQHFWLRRALRILQPFYLVALAATLIALMLYPPGMPCARLRKRLTH
jgi:peptidoglycan/LPS O-acetylase OafA/YrhL